VFSGDGVRTLVLVGSVMVGLVVLTGWMIKNPVMISRSEGEQIHVDAGRLRQHVETLCAIQPARSHAHPESLDRAGQYIENEFRQITSRVEVQAFVVDGIEYRNISALFGPKEGDRLVVGAHYDVCGDQPGADDNASGVAGLLELASHLGRSDLRRPVELVAYTLEEPPHFRTPDMGSARHARSLVEKNISVAMMISLECIGYFSDAENSQKYPVRALGWIYPSHANFITVVGNLASWGAVRHVKSIMTDVCQVPVESINAPAWISGIDFSDQLNYWKYGFDAVMITNTAFYRNKNYHEVGDLPETLDYEKMADVVAGIVRAVVTY